MEWLEGHREARTCHHNLVSMRHKNMGKQTNSYTGTRGMICSTQAAGAMVLGILP